MVKTPVKNDTRNKKKAVINLPSSYFDKNPSWRFVKSRGIENEKWILTHDRLDNDLFNFLIAIEKQTWKQICSDKKKNHHINKDDMIKEVREYMEKPGFGEEAMFSIRVNSKHRIFGIISSDGVFEIHFNDLLHEICKSKKKHT